MERKGYGAEVARAVHSIPYGTLIHSEEIAGQLANRFALPSDQARAAANVKLKRMADSGEIRRIQKGVYCHLKQTIFGKIPPDIDRLMIRELTMQKGKRIGFESGASLLNRLGLTTLLPRVTEITTNQSNLSLPEGCHIKVKAPPTTAVISDENWKYLQFLDAVGNLSGECIDVQEPERILQEVVRKQELDALTVIFTARRYYPSATVLKVTDLLMEGIDETSFRQRIV